MEVPEAERLTLPDRIELIAYAKERIEADGGDAVAPIIQELAAAPWRQGVFFGPLHTCEWSSGLWPRTQMRGFFFAVPEGVNMRRLCSCTLGARLVVSVMPITAGEIQLAKTLGPEKLLERFEAEGVGNLFDPFRASVA